MAMSKAAGIAGLISAFVLSVPGATWAQQENATPEEVVQRVKEAAAYLARTGEPGLETFRSKELAVRLEGQLCCGRQLRARPGDCPSDPAG